MAEKYYKVLLPVPNNGILTYKSDKILKRGQRIIVSLKNRFEYGVVLEEDIAPKEGIRYKYVEEVVDEFLVNEKFLEFIFFISKYYCCEVGIVFKNVISKKIFFSKEIECTNKKDVAESDILLYDEQQNVYDKIANNIKGFNVHYIDGVTGSGKTEIYLKVSKDVMKYGKQVLYLLPEIALTAQLTKRISERLGFDVDVYHSKIPLKKRVERFWKFTKSANDFLLGTKSALFIPSSNIGLIIVDEEHESTLKQEEAPYYNLRDIAIYYAKLLNIPIILGSATPAAESYYNFTVGKYNHYFLSKRFNKAKIPYLNVLKVEKDELIGKIISERLVDEIENRLSKDEQVIIFLNKKGYSHHMVCEDCGESVMCPNCSVGLTYFQSSKQFLCHYCGERFYNYTCPVCKSDKIYGYGYGIEHLQNVLSEIFGDIILKLDTDEITSHTALNKKLNKFLEKDFKILIGTQIIAKGFNFPDVTLVGILDIDRLLGMPDFRSYERCFQLVNQVGGRAGRFEKEGEILIQTFNKKNPFFEYLNNREMFYKYELEKRKLFKYPPYYKLARFITEHSNEQRCEMTILEISDILKTLPNITLLGPAKAPIYKIKNRYRYQCLIKAKNIKDIHNVCKIAKSKFEQIKKGNIYLKIDIDPTSFM
ncbi:primosomal replication factor Y [Deferribacter desulfuricans SSM1]|uniref:Replication restart protein PriA n=1 Tax=Deferribacter desulfuricans (strain DSM 14783 / JCM 11476 / NBRC 101012 / SSM1) TaxID=639282 RepID=D3P8H1_DEFDS|nr:primosomal protein N' [Deferribacter desulfuricans]BAI81011.1 primosomal replication factor Y [Deferribacter desulfuricans SSM1]